MNELTQRKSIAGRFELVRDLSPVVNEAAAAPACAEDSIFGTGKMLLLISFMNFISIGLYIFDHLLVAKFGRECCYRQVLLMKLT